MQLAFDVTGDPAFPEKAAFEVARELGLPVTTHAGVWGATNDDGIRLMHENGFMTPETTYVHAATLDPRLATSGSRPPAARSRWRPSPSRAPGQGHAAHRQVLQYGIPVSLSMDTSVWWSGDLFSAMRTTLSADRWPSTWRPTSRARPSPHLRLRAEHVVEWATRGGAHASAATTSAASSRARRPTSS